MLVKCLSVYGGELFLMVSDIEVFPMSNGRFDIYLTTYSGKTYCAKPSLETRNDVEDLLSDINDCIYLDYVFREVNV